MALPAIPGTPSNFLPVWQTILKSPIHNQIHVMNINPMAESNSGNNNSKTTSYCCEIIEDALGLRGGGVAVEHFY